MTSSPDVRRPAAPLRPIRLRLPGRLFVAAWLILALLAAAGAAAGEDRRAASQAAGGSQIVQTECPVMAGNKIDPSIYTEHDGKRVYFCCLACKEAFEKEPGKYLARLPQFAGAPAAAAQGPEQPTGGGSLAIRSIKPMGALTLVLVALTVCLGVLRRLRPRPLLKVHKTVGVCALVAGAVHAVLVMIAH